MGKGYRSADEHVEAFIGYVRSGVDLDRKNMAARDPYTADGLKTHFGSYYNGLTHVQEVLRERGESGLAERADPKRWYRFSHERRRQEKPVLTSAEKAKRAVEGMRKLRADQSYYPAQIGKACEFGHEPITGRELFKALKKEGWLSGRKVGERLGYDPNATPRALVEKIAGEGVCYVAGGHHFLLFPPYVCDETKKARPVSSADCGLVGLADKLGVGFFALKSLFGELGVVDGKVSEADLSVVRGAVLSARKSLDAGVAALDRDGWYSPSDLERRGLPAHHFRKLLRVGSDKGVVRTADGERQVRGGYVVDYFSATYGVDELFQGAGVLSLLYDSLLTPAHISRELGVPLSTIHGRMRCLLDERAPCFKVKKGSGRGQLVLPREYLRLVGDWGSRGSLRLLSALAGKVDDVQQRSLLEIAEKLYDFGECGFSEEAQRDAFVALLEARSLLGVSVDAIDATRRSLHSLEGFMSSRGFDSLYALGGEHSLDDVALWLESLEGIRPAVDNVRMLEWFLYDANRELINVTARLIGVDAELYAVAADEGLMTAVKEHNPSKGKFSNFAIAVIKRRIFRELRKNRRNVSLFTPLGEDGAELVTLLQDDRELVYDEDERKKRESFVHELLASLSPTERHVLQVRYGLKKARGVEKKGRKGAVLSQKDAGSLFGKRLSPATIGKIEQEAIKKLQEKIKI
ncbi:hypothetical protein COV18_02395 [Candidatus Woesearchaeota archaeon CG10_big_fil_rev_8_21_14_0_10_37_12]|nr:MAG: hypothetical protein COV18_02395 [Candidatus Woesearchaeota archaeon CG10_big_fil_rev_8_21_14_0_10_37_12]